MEQIFDPGPGFWAVAPNVPKMAQNTKIVTTYLLVYLLNLLALSCHGKVGDATGAGGSRCHFNPGDLFSCRVGELAHVK